MLTASDICIIISLYVYIFMATNGNQYHAKCQTCSLLIKIALIKRNTIFEKEVYVQECREYSPINVLRFTSKTEFMFYNVEKNREGAIYEKE